MSVPVEAIPAAAAPPVERSAGVWRAAWRRLRNDRVGMVSLYIVAAFVLLVILASAGILARNWQLEVGVPNAPPTFLGPGAVQEKQAIEAPQGPNLDISDVDPLAPRYKEWEERAAKISITEIERSETLPFGGDRLGRDVLQKAIKGAQISIFVGLAAAIVATIIGTLLGALAGYVGGRLGDFLEWVYNVFTSIPYILLVFVFAAILGRGIDTVIWILGLTGWTGIYRLVRAEYIKHSTREYVRAAEAIGVSHLSRMFVHILPNVSHVILVQLSLHVVSFIKAEVILSFLGLGVPVDSVSWGTMLAEANVELVLGHWWQLAAATLFMATFVTAFSLLTDALRDALDPKLR